MERIGITGIAAGGAGVGRLQDGRAVFVHRTAPGDVAEVRLTQRRSRWARGSLVRILEAGPGRRTAPCPHYERCGGCTLEHLEEAAQRNAKAGIVRDALSRIGGVHAPLPEVVASPRSFRYRNRVSMTLLRVGGGRVVAGFHELERPTRIVDVDEQCLLPEPALAEAWGRLRASWGDGAERLPAGRSLRLTLRASMSGAVALLVDGGRGRGAPEALLDDVAGLSAVWHRQRAGAAPRLLAGREALPETWREEELELGGTVFLQVNRDAARLLEAYVLECAGDVDGRRVVDAYSGVGLHARRLARRGARVTAIELDASAVREGRRGAPEVEFLVGSVESHLETALPADLVILNPPRAGVHERVAEILAARPPARMLYVSCDPATLARDVQRLGPALRVRTVRCFDLFPQTAHVETVVEMACDTM